MKTLISALLFMPSFVIGYVIECAWAGFRAGREAAAEE